jgi:hypothetical protein
VDARSRKSGYPAWGEGYHQIDTVPPKPGTAVGTTGLAARVTLKDGNEVNIGWNFDLTVWVLDVNGNVVATIAGQNLRLDTTPYPRVRRFPLTSSSGELQPIATVQG